MRLLSLIVLLFITHATVAQERSVLDFAPNKKQLSEANKNILAELIKDKKVSAVNISSILKSSGTISNSRIMSEWRLLNTRRFFEQNGIAPQRISAQIIVESDSADIEADQILINISFDETPKGLVLKKTPTVQISLVEFENKKEVAVVSKKEEVKAEKTEEKKILDISEFKKDNLITLTNLLFESGLHLIIPSSRQVLLELLEIMRDNPKLQIELQGHICCRKYGLDGYDPVSRRENLSEMRAKTVYNFLVNQGIAAERMSYKGFGSSRKLQDDAFNPEAAQRNRRVEVLITEVE